MDRRDRPLTDVRVGVDTGGTFTDVVAADGAVRKVLSTPDDPGRAVTAGLGDCRPALLAHGTTVATNALLQRRGARVALITDKGFEDVIEIARQDRPSLYDPWVDRPEPLVPRHRRLGPESDLEPSDVEAVAVCLLHADRDPAPEQAVARRFRARGFDVTCSSEVAPEFREYERTVTTVVNAYLRPLCRAYLAGLADLADEVLVMTSAGGLISAAEAADLPVALVLSGPAAGALAAAEAATAAGFPDAVSFDMGGTSTDVCLIAGGVPEPAPGRSVAGFPLRLPSVDVHTIGAGGGSIARIDSGGALRVGPMSAGADPGPACYGRGGTEPTVTDADLVLGHIPPDAVLGDLGRLDTGAAKKALDAAGATAEGVVRVVDAAMEQAVRAVTVARGTDPRDLALVAFGGAGPLHGCAVAEALGMTTVLVPPRAGVLSAVGLLTAPRQRDLVRSWPGSVDELVSTAREAVGGGDDVEVTTSFDCRYIGQSHEITVPDVESFDEEHRRRNGYARPGTPVEVVAVRAGARRPPAMAVGELPVIAGDATMWVPDGWRPEAAEGGGWTLRRSRS